MRSAAVAWFARIREMPVVIVSSRIVIFRLGTTVRTFGFFRRAATALAEPLNANPCSACR